MSYELLSGMWAWASGELIGSTLIAGGLILAFAIAVLAVMRMPPPVIAALLGPLVVGLLINGYIGWMGWIILAMTGALFGFLAYKMVAE